MTGRTAHPRSRGENVGDLGDEGCCIGSSPLTRGKPCERRTLTHSGRLIPAHAGKTCAIVGRSGVIAAHPRSRGEN